MSREQHPLSWIPEILLKIFLQTDTLTLLNSQRVCRQWQTIIKELGCVKETVFFETQERFIETLDSIYDRVENVETPFLDSASLSDLPIQCEVLKLTDDGIYEEAPEPCFFDPNAEIYPKDLADDDWKLREYEDSYRAMQRSIDNGSSVEGKTGHLCYEMEREFRSYRSRHPNGDKSSLFLRGHWKPAG